MTASRDDLLDAAALIAAIARGDDEAAGVLLDHADLRSVVTVVATWCAGWLLDAAALGHQDQAWWLGELHRWVSKELPGDHPWQVR